MNLRTARKLAKLSQKELARRAQLDSSTIGQLERGTNKNPKWDTAHRIADALGVEVYDIFPVPALPKEVAR